MEIFIQSLPCLRTNIVRSDSPILASETLKVINKKTKNIDILCIIKNKFIIKKINNINISKIINKIIRWYQILEKKILSIINCKKNKINKDDTTFNEKIKQVINIIIKKIIDSYHQTIN